MSKFFSGAWVAIIAVGLFLLVTLRIRRHYEMASSALHLLPHTADLPTHTAEEASLAQQQRILAGEKRRTVAVGGETEELPQEINLLSVVAVATLDLASMRALAYAASSLQPVLAVHSSVTEEEAQRFRGYWTRWGDHLPLEIVVSPYRAAVVPLVHHVEALHRRDPELTLTVILPEIVARRRPLARRRRRRCRRRPQRPGHREAFEPVAVPAARQLRVSGLHLGKVPAARMPQRDQ
ncbi:hypothetical protein AB0K62_04285 [Streptomyces halstedii]|uniref:hypothetical protein n=1 Tax=Streptomyces halstedii TaxID=1944 RepID=UPI00345FF761|nr:hypothetical protein OG291_23775 [Streptomyces halstedii]